MSSYSLRTPLSYTRTLEDLAESFGKWRVQEWEVRPMRVDGRVSWYGRAERAVTLRYFPRGASAPVVLTMDKQDRPQDNLRVLYLAIEAMRLNEARGISDVVRDAYMQLAAPARERDPFEVLGVRSDAAPEIIEAAYRAAAKKAHPDAGGTDEQMAALNAAYEAVRR